MKPNNNPGQGQGGQGKTQQGGQNKTPGKTNQQSGSSQKTGRENQGNPFQQDQNK